MSWQIGLMLVLLAMVALPWLFASICERFNQPDELDPTADRHRKVVERGQRTRAGHREETRRTQ